MLSVLRLWKCRGRVKCSKNGFEIQLAGVPWSDEMLGFAPAQSGQMLITLRLEDQILIGADSIQWPKHGSDQRRGAVTRRRRVYRSAQMPLKKEQPSSNANISRAKCSMASHSGRRVKCSESDVP